MALKLHPGTFWITAASLGLAVLSYGYFMVYKPNKDEEANYIEYKNQLDAEAGKMPAAKRRVKETTEKLRAIDAEWQDVVERKTPPANLRQGGIDLSVNRYQLVVDSRVYRNRLQQALNYQLRKGGIKVITGPEIPAFPDDPATIVETGFNFPGYPFPVLLYDLGQVTVEGTWEQILRHVESWNGMPNYLAVTDGLAITGTSPTLRGTYNLSIVGFVRTDKVAPPVPAGAAPEFSGGSGGGTGGGGGTGPGGGAPADPFFGGAGATSRRGG